MKISQSKSKLELRSIDWSLVDDVARFDDVIGESRFAIGASPDDVIGLTAASDDWFAKSPDDVIGFDADGGRDLSPECAAPGSIFFTIDANVFGGAASGFWAKADTFSVFASEEMDADVEVAADEPKLADEVARAECSSISKSSSGKSQSMSEYEV